VRLPPPTLESGPRITNRICIIPEGRVRKASRAAGGRLVCIKIAFHRAEAEVPGNRAATPSHADPVPG